jgi:hypothetical protein
MNDPLTVVRARVSALRSRHFVIAGIFAAIGAATWALPETELPVTGKAVISLALLGAAAWQGSLAWKIGLGLAAVDAGRPAIVWIYELRAHIDGVQVATGVMIGLETGARHELPVSLDPADVPPLMAHLRSKHPHATFGHDPSIESRFVADPRSVRTG